MERGPVPKEAATEDPHKSGQPMLSSFRKMSKSKVGTAIMALILIGILAGFALSDIRNFGSGEIGFGLGGDNLVEVGREKVSQRAVSEAMQRRLEQVRQQQPNADYSTVARDFPEILNALIDQHALIAFADKFGFHVSKRLVDAEIAQLPETRGLNGQFSDDAYKAFLARRRMTDQEIRGILKGGILQRLMVTPVAVNARIPVGLATPYASMLLETRSGEVAAVPIDAFAAGLNPSDKQVQQFYASHRNRYVVPEQRTLKIATITEANLGNVMASEAEVASYYEANKASYASASKRSLTQVVVPDQKTASAIAAKAKAGSPLATAAAPAGSSAALTDLKDQSRADYAAAAGDAVANAAFAAPAGAIVGPLRSDFGWVVVKVNSVREQGGKSLAEARGEIAAKLTQDKRKVALEDLVDKVQTALDDGSNFAEAVAAAKLSVTTTPLVMANGASRTNASVRLPQTLAPALKAGFEIAATDPPEIVELADGKGYAVVAPDRVIPAAPAPLASIRDRVARDWVVEQATARAKAAAQAIAAKVGTGVAMADAVRQAGVPLPAPKPISARRIQIANAQGKVPSAMRMLFSLSQGKSRMIGDDQGRGFFVVKATQIVPGNALLQPALISEMQSELQNGQSQEYAVQFLNAIKQQLRVSRDDKAIAALEARLRSGGN